MNSKTFRYFLAGAWGVLIALLPFIVSSSLFFPFITGKNIFFRIVVEIVFVLWAASCIQDKSLRPKWGWLIGAFGGFTLWVGIANMNGIDPLRSFWSNFERMEGYITLLHLFALFIVSAASLTKDLWYKLIMWSVIVSGVAWIQGMVEHLKDVNFRIDGSFGNAVYFAVYSLIHIFFAIILAIKYKESRYVWIVLAVFNLSVIFYSGTRGAIIALVGGSVVAAVLYLISERKNKTTRNISLAILGFIALSTIALGFGWQTDFIAKSPVLSRFGQLAHYAVTLDIKGLITDIGRSRTAIWGIAWEGVKERPVIGWGQDNFIQVFSKHYDPKIFDQEQWFDRTHNVFFDWLIASGFVGLFGYLAVFAVMITYLWKRQGFELYEKIIITGLIVAYFIHTFFVFDNITSYIFIILMWAMVHNVSSQQENVEQTKQNKNSQSLRGVSNSSELIIAGLIVVSIIIGFVNVPAYTTASNLIKGLVYSYGNSTQAPNDAMIQESKKFFTESLKGSEFAKVEVREQLVTAVERVLTSSAATSTKIDFINLVTGEINKNIEAHPTDARVHYFAGVYYSSINDWQNAIVYLEKALALSPNKQTMMFLLADMYNRVGKKDMAALMYKQAFEAAPSFVEPRLRYVDALISQGKKSDAESLMKDVSSESLQDLRYVNLLMSVKRYDVIVDIFKKELEKDPNNIQARVSLAAAYVQAGQKDAAVVVLETIIRDVPQSKDQINYFISEIKAGRNPVQ